MDSNGNGKVTLEELNGWFKSRAEKNPDKFTYKAEQPRAALAKHDANKDNELTLEEWTKWRMAIRFQSDLDVGRQHRQFNFCASYWGHQVRKDSFSLSMAYLE